MRILANENMPAGAVMALRDAGCDVAWVRQDAPGMPDSDVIAWAQREQRVLLTFDKDFGELAFHARLSSQCGVILFRVPVPRTEEADARMAALVMGRDDWTGRFSVVEPGRVRMRDIPQAQG